MRVADGQQRNLYLRDPQQLRFGWRSRCSKYVSRFPYVLKRAAQRHREVGRTTVRVRAFSRPNGVPDTAADLQGIPRDTYFKQSPRINTKLRNTSAVNSPNRSIFSFASCVALFHDVIVRYVSSRLTTGRRLPWMLPGSTRR